MRTSERTRPKQTGARMTIAYAYLAGIALISGWSLRGGAAADRPAELAMRHSEKGIANVANAPANATLSISKPRSRRKCPECGVVESVQKIDTHHQIVVRLRDGTKQVFDETTPRTLRVGDRIMVIARTDGNAD
jgi:hypothetical protein